MNLAMWVLAGLVLGGCGAKQIEYHFACYTYHDLSENSRNMIEYPCKVKRQTKRYIGDAFYQWQDETRTP